jgi:hypothetical protein
LSNVPFGPFAFCQRVQVDDASRSGGNQPGKANQSIDSIENSICTERIMVVDRPMPELVVLMRYPMPGDPTIRAQERPFITTGNAAAKVAQLGTLQNLKLWKQNSKGVVL